MKRLKTFLVTSFLLICATSFSIAETKQTEEKDLYEYNNLVLSLSKPGKPIITDKYIIFTAESGPRFVGISFDFENYSTIHSFEIRKTRDVENNVTRSIIFYLLERPRNLTEVSYRLIIDGLWTSDPLNPEKQYDYKTGITLSKIYLQNTIPEVTGYQEESVVKFIYKGEPGQNVRLGGNFTNWDSWIYTLEETKPGFYELSIPLPTGIYYYNYYLGMNSFVDKTNPNRAYTPEGRTASVIKVN